MSADANGQYAKSGVDYEVLDSAKRAALGIAAMTSAYGSKRGADVVDSTRGEPATLVTIDGLTLGFVLECLGTKSMIARKYQDLTGEDRFADVAYDTVAAIVNDLCCVGALPFIVNAYFATGSAEWYDGSRASSLVEGWRAGCHDAGAAWGGGESPTLSGLIAPGEIDLAGSAIGRVPKGVKPPSGDKLVVGDEIVIVSSSGLHANGASLVRTVAASLPNGLLTTLDSGTTLGSAVLDASVIYVGLVERLLEAGCLHYASNITGHGLRKLMRAERDVTYRVTDLPAVPEVLQFLADSAGFSAEVAYGTLNMGAGFALFTESGSAKDAVKVAKELGLVAIVAGCVEDGPKRVILEPVGVEYSSEELNLR